MGFDLISFGISCINQIISWIGLQLFLCIVIGLITIYCAMISEKQKLKIKPVHQQYVNETKTSDNEQESSTPEPNDSKFEFEKIISEHELELKKITFENEHELQNPITEKESSTSEPNDSKFELEKIISENEHGLELKKIISEYEHGLELKKMTFEGEHEVEFKKMTFEGEHEMEFKKMIFEGLHEMEFKKTTSENEHEFQNPINDNEQEICLLALNDSKSGAKIITSENEYQLQNPINDNEQEISLLELNDSESGAITSENEYQPRNPMEFITDMPVIQNDEEITFDKSIDSTNILLALNKDRAKIQVKRKKSTRRGRQTLQNIDNEKNEEIIEMKQETEDIKKLDAGDLFLPTDSEENITSETPIIKAPKKEQQEVKSLMAQLMAEAVASKIGKRKFSSDD